MTSGGITKRTFCVWASIGFLIVSILCAIEAITGGDSVYRALALLALVFALISFAGVWANGLPKSADPDE